MSYVPQLGPPINRAHVREWSVCEFVHLCSKVRSQAAHRRLDREQQRRPTVQLAVCGRRERSDPRMANLEVPTDFYRPWTLAQSLECVATIQTRSQS